MAVRNYLCFGGDSPIVRGLDLLLEIFPKHPDLHLHVCGGFRTDPDFCATYREALDETPNVHAVGYVPIDDPRFYDLIRRCAWMIYPTASEGQSGSVVQCMHAGIIPIVTREAGLDVQDFGFVLADDSLAEIERTIRRLAATPEAECLDRTRRTRTAAERDFSEGAFAKRWEAILDELLPNASSR
jgi:glycosyltransferase involved in cell wall biosynthesis